MIRVHIAPAIHVHAGSENVIQEHDVLASAEPANGHENTPNVPSWVWLKSAQMNGGGEEENEFITFRSSVRGWACIDWDMLGYSLCCPSAESGEMGIGSGHMWGRGPIWGKGAYVKSNVGWQVIPACPCLACAGYRTGQPLHAQVVFSKRGTFSAATTIPRRHRVPQRQRPSRRCGQQGQQ